MIPESDSAEAFLDAAPATVGNSGAPALRLGAYEGPLDLLLELARAQRVDLAQISVAILIEQFGEVVAAAIAQRRVLLPRLANQLIITAWLTLLRSRLLLPAAAAESAEAEREAAGLRRKLADREWASHLADWLERRRQLGRQAFAQADAEPTASTIAGVPLLADTTELLPACLRLLVLRHWDWVVTAAATGAVASAGCAPAHAGAAAGGGEGAHLVTFLPPLSEERARSRLLRRAALATTLMAGLGLGRDGVVILAQDDAFSQIRMQPSGPRGTVVAVA